MSDAEAQEGWEPPLWGAGHRVDPTRPHALEHSPGHGMTQSSMARPAPSWSQTPAEQPGACFGVHGTERGGPGAAGLEPLESSGNLQLLWTHLWELLLLLAASPRMSNTGSSSVFLDFQMPLGTCGGFGPGCAEVPGSGDRWVLPKWSSPDVVPWCLEGTPQLLSQCPSLPPRLSSACLAPVPGSWACGPGWFLLPPAGEGVCCPDRLGE